MHEVPECIIYAKTDTGRWGLISTRPYFFIWYAREARERWIVVPGLTLCLYWSALSSTHYEYGEERGTNREVRWLDSIKRNYIYNICIQISTYLPCPQKRKPLRDLTKCHHLRGTNREVRWLDSRERNYIYNSWPAATDLLARSARNVDLSAWFTSCLVGSPAAWLVH